MTVTKAPTRIPPLPGSAVPFPAAGLLYAIGLAEDKCSGRFRRVYLTTTTRPHPDPSEEPWEGVVTRDELVDIGPDGPLPPHCFEYTGDVLQECLERLHADLVWLKTGQLVGPYAEPDVDLDTLSPQAKQTVLDVFVADLEARREPRKVGPLPPPPPEHAGRGQVNGVDPDVERIARAMLDEVARKHAVHRDMLLDRVGAMSGKAVEALDRLVATGAVWLDGDQVRERVAAPVPAAEPEHGRVLQTLR
jgi:hypothetical protein